MMAPTTCPESAALKALVSSVLPPSEEERLTVHLESCGRCRAALQLLVASSTSRANLPRRLIEVLPTDPVLRESLPRITADGRRRKPLVLALVAALLLVIAAAAYYFIPSFLKRRTGEQPQRTEFDPPPKKTTDPVAPAEDPVALARRVGAVLTANCYRCHGENGSVEGGFNYVLNRERLVARKKIVPGKPDKSPLLERIVDGEMPPEGEKSRPDKDEVALLKRWVEVGAPDFGPSSVAPSSISSADMVQSIRDDLEKRSKDDRPFARYFTLTHLYNAGLSQDELQSYRNGISKLLNSLSWNRTVILPVAVDEAKTVLRIDLNDYKWGEREWEALVAQYPYAVNDGSKAQQYCAEATGCAVPAVRGDWFVAVAARPPLYHELLQLPQSDAELEKSLHVNVAADLKARRVARAGFNNSGISHNNRLIERHETPYGAYWKSYDFKENVGAENLFERPLGPGDDEHSFRHAGGEIIFNLPNGLQAYMLVNAQGSRIDRAPTEIVSDPKRPDRAVENGLSCMSCHARGIIAKDDQVRPHVEKNRGAFPGGEAETILALYPPAEKFRALQQQDLERFGKAAAAAGARAGASEPILALTLQYEAPLSERRAAAEIGISTKELGDAIAGTPELGRALGSIRSEGATVPRRLFADSFGDLSRALHRGEPLRPGGTLPLPSALKERTVVDLPEPYEDVKTGGGGRFLIFHLKKAKKLAIFDILQAKIVHEISIQGEDVRFAAGRDKLMVVLPAEKVIQRYDLRSFQREKTAPVPDGMSVWKVLMGYTSQGPLVLWGTGDKAAMLDIERMEPIETNIGAIRGTTKFGFDVRVSPDGQTFITWHNGLWPSNFGIHHVTAGRKLTGESLEAGFNGNWIQPNTDGSLLMHNSGRTVSRDLKAYSADWLIGFILMPSDDPRFFLSAHGLEVDICTSSDRRPIFTVTDKALDRMNASSEPTRWYHSRGEPRIHYLPDHHLLAFVTAKDTQIVVRPFNLIEELRNEGKEYLFVQSQPKTHVKAGGVYQYQMEVKSKSSGVVCKLEKGPDGMTVSGGGEVRWNVPQKQTGKGTPVIISVKNAAGKELFHTFDLVVD